MHTDALLYRLFQERPATLFELADLPHSGAGYRLTAIEIKETAFRLDGILLPPDDAPAQDPAVFLENQFQCPDPAVLSIGARLLRLVVVATADLPAEAIDLAETARGEPDPLPLMDLIETILVYKLPNLSRDEIKAMLHLPDTDLKQTRFYQEVFAEGREEGLEEGLEAGRKAGRTETQRQTVLNLLRQTSLGDAAIAAVTGLDAETVTALRRGP